MTTEKAACRCGGQRGWLVWKDRHGKKTYQPCSCLQHHEFAGPCPTCELILDRGHGFRTSDDCPGCGVPFDKHDPKDERLSLRMAAGKINVDLAYDDLLQLRDVFKDYVNRMNLAAIQPTVRVTEQNARIIEFLDLVGNPAQHRRK